MLEITDEWNQTRMFREVDIEDINEIDKEYFVWNIGRKNFEVQNCVPLCVDIGDYRIDNSRLISLNVHDEDIALKIMNEAGKKTVDIKRILEIVNMKGNNND